jgi:hypothetical protein
LDKTLDIFEDVETLPAISPTAEPPAKKKRWSRKSLQRELDSRTAEKLPDVLDAALSKALTLINGNNEKAATALISVVFEAAGLKQRTGMTVNVQQNNSNGVGAGTNFRSIDSIIRAREQAAQRASEQIIDVTPERR